MTGEDMEKTMQFILEQQAQVTVKLELVGDRIGQLTEEVKPLKEVTSTHSQVLDQMAAMLEKLIETQARTDAKLAEIHARTDEKMAKTDERLNTFIATVERHITEGRNGKP